jgi:hypothetical protein
LIVWSEDTTVETSKGDGENDSSAHPTALVRNVNNGLSLSLADILAMPRVELAAVNQCSGNSRGFFQPRVFLSENSDGSM